MLARLAPALKARRHLLTAIFMLGEGVMRFEIRCRPLPRGGEEQVIDAKCNTAAATVRMKTEGSISRRKRAKMIWREHNIWCAVASAILPELAGLILRTHVQWPTEPQRTFATRTIRGNVTFLCGGSERKRVETPRGMRLRENGDFVGCVTKHSQSSPQSTSAKSVFFTEDGTASTEVVWNLDPCLEER